MIPAEKTLNVLFWCNYKYKNLTLTRQKVWVLSSHWIYLKPVWQVLNFYFLSLPLLIPLSAAAIKYSKAMDRKELMRLTVPIITHHCQEVKADIYIRSQEQRNQALTLLHTQVPLQVPQHCMGKLTKLKPWGSSWQTYTYLRLFVHFFQSCWYFLYFPVWDFPHLPAL